MLWRLHDTLFTKCLEHSRCYYYWKQKHFFTKVFRRWSSLIHYNFWFSSFWGWKILQNSFGVFLGFLGVFFLHLYSGRQLHPFFSKYFMGEIPCKFPRGVSGSSSGSLEPGISVIHTIRVLCAFSLYSIVGTEGAGVRADNASTDSAHILNHGFHY